jgi:hypothetical protein
MPGAPPGIVVPIGRDTIEVPATAVGSPAPQLVTAFGVGATTRPAGKVSTKAVVSVATPALLLLNVMVSLDTPPAVILVGKNALLLVAVPAGVTGGTKAAQVGTVIVVASVVTVPPNDKALPVTFAKCPNVIPASSMMVPRNVGVSDAAAFAPSVVAPTGAQNTSDSQAPPAATTLELAPVVSAPAGLKM